MDLLLILIFAGSAVVNYFNTRVALWIALAGLLLPLVLGLVDK